MIHRDMQIEELVRVYPPAVRYLMKHGIRCIACGEPLWGTLAEAAAEKGFGDAEIDGFVRELNLLMTPETREENA